MLRRLLLLTGLIILLAACQRTAPPNDPLPRPGTPVPPTTASPPSLPPTTAANTPAAPRPQPSATPPPGATATALPGTVSAIREPLLVDGAGGRIFARAQVNAVPKTVVLSAADGGLRAVYDEVGQLAYQMDQLVIDQPQRLLAYDTTTGRVQFEVALPPAGNAVAPQIGQLSGRIFAFRGRTVYVIDRHSGEILDARELTIATSVCGERGEPAAIAGSQYDLISRTLYLDFTTYVCTPWFDRTLIAYDYELNEQGRFLAGRTIQTVPFAGNLHGTTASRFGPVQHWAWSGQGDEAWFRAEGEAGAGLHGIVADWERGLIYEGVGAAVRVIDAGTRAVQQTVPVELLQEEGRLAGHDPVGDHLYLLTGSGQLTVWPTTELLAGGAPPAADTELPQTAVHKIIPAATWPDALSLVALWQNPACPAGSGDLYLSRNAQWQPLRVTADGACVTDVAWAADGTLFAAGHRLDAVVRSTDDGRSWHPAGMAGTGPGSLLLSSGFAQDGTVFLHADDGRLFRSTDAGETFTLLDRTFAHIALSHEFGADQTLLGATGSDLHISGDGGSRWQVVGPLPGREPLALLSLAPQFAQWQTLFAFTQSGTFYRSQDGGASWQAVLATGPVTEVQIVYGPTAAGREIFLHHDHGFAASYDGWDSTWSTDLTFHPSVRLLSTMTLSPNFANDGALFVGTTDGHIVTVPAGRPQ